MRPEAVKQDSELKANEQKQTLGKRRPEQCKGTTNYKNLER